MWNFLVPAAMGLLSAKNAEQKNEQMKAQNLANAAQTRYSAWSGLGGGQINNSYANPFAQALSGGLQGAAFMQAMNQNGQQNPMQTQEDQMDMQGMTSMNMNPQLYGSKWGSIA